VASNGRYTLFTPTSNDPGAVERVRDETTGRSSTVPEGCVNFFGGPWLLAEPCFSGTINLYRLTTGQQMSLTEPAAECAAAPGQTCVPLGVGSQWLEFGSGCYHCQTIDYLQSLSTGAVTPAPTLPATEMLDLNRVTPIWKLCAPIRVPRGGTVAPVGNYALITTSTRALYLQHCGSRHRRSINAYVGANPRVLLWTEPASSPTPHLVGLNRRTGRRFQVRTRGVPRAVLVLSGPRLYALATGGPLFTATAPAPPGR
jgi:hypothetical protein